MGANSPLVPAEIMGFAEAGDQSAQLLVAFSYYQHRDIPGNLSIAEKWFRAAARQGSGDAQFTIGCLLDNENRTKEERAEARFWLELATDQGHSQATLRLGLMHLYGSGGPEDRKKGYELVKQAAYNNDVRAQLVFAVFEVCGAYSRERSENEIRLIEDLASQGKPDAQCVLGALLYTGHGSLQRDHSLAVKLLEASTAKRNYKARCLVKAITILIAPPEEIADCDLYSALCDMIRAGAKQSLLSLCQTSNTQRKN
jgi:uncharacterized protein